MEKTYIETKVGRTARDRNTGVWVTLAQGGDFTPDSPIAVKPKYTSLAYRTLARDLDFKAKDPHAAFSRIRAALLVAYLGVLVLVNWKVVGYLDAHHIGMWQRVGLSVSVWFTLSCALSRVSGLTRR